MSFAKYLLPLGFAASAIGLISCSIPKPECTVGQTSTPQIGLNFAGLSAFSVRYVLKDSTGMECANFKGEVVGFQSYHPAKDEGGQKVRDFTKTMVAVRSASLGELAWMTEELGNPGTTVTPNAIGNFDATDPNADDMCTVKTFAAAQVQSTATQFPSDASLYPLADPNLPETCAADTDCNGTTNAVCTGDGVCGVAPECMADADCNAVTGATCFGADAMTPGFCAIIVDIPATDLKYEWSNVKFYVTAAATGTQFSADVKITLNGCEANYSAIGMWPAIDCTPFPFADPTATAGCMADTDCTKKDFNTCVDGACSHIVSGDELCDSEPDADHGRPVGSGINPDFGPIACDVDFSVAQPLIDYYNIPDIGGPSGGAPVAEPRCVINSDKIPALQGNSKGTSTSSQ
jgi:hypothetical protein